MSRRLCQFLVREERYHPVHPSPNKKNEKVDKYLSLLFEPLKLLSFDFNADQDPAFHSNADPYSAYQNNTDPSGSGPDPHWLNTFMRKGKDPDSDLD